MYFLYTFYTLPGFARLTTPTHIVLRESGVIFEMLRPPAILLCATTFFSSRQTILAFISSLIVYDLYFTAISTLCHIYDFDLLIICCRTQGRVLSIYWPVFESHPSILSPNDLTS